MVRQLEKECFNNYAWMDRSNVGMGYYVNLPFAFADLDDLCRDIERELDSGSLGAGFTSQGQKIDEFAEHRGYLLRYINDVLYDISDYLEIPLYKGFNEAMDHMAGIDMTDGKTDNTIGLQTNVSVYGGGRGYGFENDMPYLTLEDFIGSRYQETEGSSYESTTYNQKVEGFADLFAEDYENLVKSGKINGKEVTLEKYLDSLVLKEFAYKKDSPFYLELIELLSELTVVIPIYEAAVGKTLITNDYLTDTEGAFKIVSATVNLVTLGQGALISEGGMAFAKMFASEVLAEAAAGSTAILSDKAGAPSSVTIALSLLAGVGTGMAANKVLLSGYGSKAVGNVVEESGKNIKEIDQLMQDAANKKTLEILENQSKTAAGPCLSEVYDPLTEKISYGQNYKTSATGNKEYYQWLENEADPVIKNLVSNYETKIKSGEIILSEFADYRLAAHSEIVALDEALKNRRALGALVDESTLSELYLHNVDLTKAYKTGEIVPKIRCEHCRHLTEGINILNHD